MMPSQLKHLLSVHFLLVAELFFLLDQHLLIGLSLSLFDLRSYFLTLLFVWTFFKQQVRTFLVRIGPEFLCQLLRVTHGLFAVFSAHML